MSKRLAPEEHLPELDPLLVRTEATLEGSRSTILVEDAQVRADILPEPQEQPDGTLVVKMRLLTATAVRRFGYIDGQFQEFDEVLSFEEGAQRTERLDSGRCPLLDDHYQGGVDSVLGVLFAPSWDRKAGFLDVSARVSARPELAGVRQDLKTRILTNVSGGYRVFKYRDITPTPPRPGPGAIIDKTNPTPTPSTVRRLLAIDWEPREGSLTAIGADPKSHVRRSPRSLPGAPTSHPPAERTMEPETAPTSTTATPTAPPVATAPATATRAAAPASPTPVVTPSAPAADPADQELERQRSIRSKLQKAGIAFDHPLAVKLLDTRSISSGEAAGQILDHLAARDAAGGTGTNGEHATVVEGEQEKTMRALEDVLTHRAMRQLLTPQERVELDKRLQGSPFVHRRLLQIGEEYLGRIHGRRDLHVLTPMDLASEVLFRRREAPLSTRAAPGYHVTSDFASVLANVANKGLQRMFQLTRETYTQWTVAGTLPDFKQAKRVALGDAPRLVRKPEGGEVSFGAISDKGENIQLLTYARAVSVSREAIINDDLGAFTRLTNAFGGAARQLEADLVYSVLTANAALADGFALFDATNHGNLVTGSGNSLATAGVDALSNVRALGRRQTGIAPGNGETPFFVSVDLVHLRVPENLETAAQKLVASIQAQQVSNVNPFQGTYETVMAEPRLGAVSQIAFYLMANPGIIDTIEVSHLQGESGPLIESRLGWTTEGVDMKCRLDVGVAATEYRGLYKNNGTT